MHKIRAAFLALVAALAVFAMCVGSNAATAPPAVSAEQAAIDTFVASVSQIIIVGLDDHPVAVILVSIAGATLVIGVRECAADAKCTAAVNARIADDHGQTLTLHSGNIRT